MLQPQNRQGFELYELALEMEVVGMLSDERERLKERERESSVNKWKSLVSRK